MKIKIKTFQQYVLTRVKLIIYCKIYILRDIFTLDFLYK